MRNRTFTFLFVLFISAGLVFGIRGLAGNVNEETLNNLAWTENGPFELSPERGRFALMYSLVENHSYSFSLPLARFAAPDVGYLRGQYVSLFAPAVSYLIMPGYAIGKMFGLSQIGAFSVIALFGLLNTLLVRATARYFGATNLASNIAAITFIFATPAYAYASTIYQHHISTFLVLSSLYVLLKSKSWWAVAYVWLMCAAAIPIDYPNLFFLFPLGVFALGRVVMFKWENYHLTLNVRLRRFVTFLALVPPVIFFFYFNKVSYGSPLQFSGTVSQVKEIAPNGLPALTEADVRDKAALEKAGAEKRSAVAFFRTRSTLNGFRSLWVSEDRGVLYFTPVILIGFYGFFLLYKNHSQALAVILGIIGANVGLYAMWSDVYGGWAFGSRYLIPTYALLAVGVALALTKWRRHILPLALFAILFYYSLGVGVLGAITSSRNPPKVEVLGLEQITGREEKYTWERNWQYLVQSSEGSKAALYQLVFKNRLSPIQYFFLVAGFIGLFTTAQIILLRVRK